MSKIGDYIRKARKGRRLGLRETARRADISATYISRMESGAEPNPPSEKVIVRLAWVLNENPVNMMIIAKRMPRSIHNYIMSVDNIVTFLKLAEGSGCDSDYFKTLIRQLTS